MAYAPKSLVKPSLRQLAVGLLVWTDGWDTLPGSKSNRSPMHTGTVTLLFVDIESKLVIGMSTFPNMGGPGKIDHGPVFQRFKDDLLQFEKDDANRVFPCCRFSANVEIHTIIMFIIQDQPERRQVSCLLGGNSTLHPLFGVSCDFSELRVPFSLCTDCMNKLEEYFTAQDWSSPPMMDHCPICISWSLERLVEQCYKIRHPKPFSLQEDSPGAILFERPSNIHYVLTLCHHSWVEADVKKYPHQLYINDATITHFIDSCR